MNAYDFDKTIYKNDSTADFYIFCIKKKPSLAFTLFTTAFSAVRYYVFKLGTKTEFKQRMYHFLTKIDAEALVEDFWEKHISGIKAFYLSQQKEDDVIISASPQFILKPACDKLGIKNLIASRVDPKSGLYSGENCHGKEKVRRFYESFPNGKIERFYSDSYSDDPLAEISEESYLVKGDKILPWR
ncbi:MULTISPECIES: HAD-IB family phosphatase [unclassified Ruminococcus]|uniref:HAD-IB family phosphatase n=1 Tax=unclassified Ruminococcus TaxID=2608920 RepID=UPI00210E702C|nr:MULTISPECIES: HAD-IB family phosphatase [unclassified Ruminococcus]MCQ4022527.1 HAD-IB family phosphatase [Ruminococcus sp. zg-924]MCQ4115129.1 HAD-IB family phosphatase [Ruminococcus sp. zg-921]